MESTLELSTIEEYASEVKEAVASCESVDRFSDHLLQKDFITRQRQSDILYNASLTPQEKVGRLVDAVLFQVKTNPSKFEVFVEILEKQPPLKDLAARLRLSYGKLDPSWLSSANILMWAPVAVFEATNCLALW